MVWCAHDGLLPGLVLGQEGNGANVAVPEQECLVRPPAEGGRAHAMALNGYLYRPRLSNQ